MKKIYIDTNQIYYIRRIAEEADGWDYGDYKWAISSFPNNPTLIEDIRALCYIIALQYEWELDIFPSDASYAELSLSQSGRAIRTKEAWELFVQGNEDQRLYRVPFLPDHLVSAKYSLEFIRDKDDRVILRHFAASDCDVLLTSDKDILEHQESLGKMNIIVLRPSEWIDIFLKDMRGENSAVVWLERVLFGIND